MSYEPQVWETGQVITAEKLNHMEEEINGVLLTCDITFVENADEDTQRILTFRHSDAELKTILEKTNNIYVQIYYDANMVGVLPLSYFNDDGEYWGTNYFDLELPNWYKSYPTGVYECALYCWFENGELNTEFWIEQILKININFSAESNNNIFEIITPTCLVLTQRDLFRQILDYISFKDAHPEIEVPCAFNIDGIQYKLQDYSSSYLRLYYTEPYYGVVDNVETLIEVDYHEAIMEFDMMSDDNNIRFNLTTIPFNKSFIITGTLNGTNLFDSTGINNVDVSLFQSLFLHYAEENSPFSNAYIKASGRKFIITRVTSTAITAICCEMYNVTDGSITIAIAQTTRPNAMSTWSSPHIYAKVLT